MTMWIIDLGNKHFSVTFGKNFLHSRTGIAAQSWLLSEVTYLFTLIWTVALHVTILLRFAGTINIWIGL